MKGYIKEYVVYSTQVLVVLRFTRGNRVHRAANWRQKIIVKRILLHQESRQENSQKELFGVLWVFNFEVISCLGHKSKKM